MGPPLEWRSGSEPPENVRSDPRLRQYRTPHPKWALWLEEWCVSYGEILGLNLENRGISDEALPVTVIDT